MGGSTETQGHGEQPKEPDEGTDPRQLDEPQAPDEVKEIKEAQVPDSAAVAKQEGEEVHEDAEGSMHKDSTNTDSAEDANADADESIGRSSDYDDAGAVNPFSLEAIKRGVDWASSRSGKLKARAQAQQEEN